MSRALNKYGLRRDIPEDIKRAVRQRDGFGCVHCGIAIYDYEHIDPPFAEAQAHDVDGIILLCSSCHRKKGKFIAVSTLLEDRKNPKALQKGYSYEAFEVASNYITVVFGSITVNKANKIIEIDGEDIFSVSPPEVEGGPFRINAKMYDRSGRAILDIVNNEWRARSSNWDVEVVSNVIKIRSARGIIPLILRVEPPNRVVIEKLDLCYKKVRVTHSKGKSTIIHGRHGERMISDDIEFEECGVVFDIRGSSVTVGGRGCIINNLSSFTYIP